MKDIKSSTLHRRQNLDLTGGSFSLSGTTGPDGNVTGSFTFSGFGQQTRLEEDPDTFVVNAEGTITNAKAAFDDKGFLRVMGAAHYERKHEFSGSASITMTYKVLVYDEDLQKEVWLGGTVSGSGRRWEKSW